jgi:hypothetical protein
MSRILPKSVAIGGKSALPFAPGLVHKAAHVHKHDRPESSPIAQARLDKSPAAFESRLFFNEGARQRFEAAYGLRERPVPESLGMLEQWDRDFHDRRGPLHARLRLLCCDNGKTFRTGGRRAGTRGGGDSADEAQARRDYGGGEGRLERWWSCTFCADDYDGTRGAARAGYRGPDSGFSCKGRLPANGRRGWTGYF